MSEPREAMKEERRELRRQRIRAGLARLWRKTAWVLAPLCTAWIVFLVILLITEKLYTRTGEWLVVALLAVPALVLLPPAVVTLVRGIRKG